MRAAYDPASRAAIRWALAHWPIDGAPLRVVQVGVHERRVAGERLLRVVIEDAVGNRRCLLVTPAGDRVEEQA
ncbi:MAG: hypothetical protein U0821_08425 [Chloroflexota bacterium]